MFLQKPSFIKCDALGIDESFYNASLRGTGTRGEEKPVIVDLADFLGDRKNARNTNPTHNLVDISRRAHAVLAAHPAGRLSRSTFHAARFVAEDARKAYAAEWERKLEPQVWPGMSAKKYKAACAKVAMHNKQVSRLARFWRLLEWTLKAPDERSPWMEVRHFINEKNQTETEISMAWSNDIHKSWLAPTMIMDATMPVEIVRRFFPTMEDPVNATAAMPHTIVRQIADRPMAASMLIPSDEASEKENKTRRNNIKKVQRYIEVRAASVRPGRVFVVVPGRARKRTTKGHIE